MGRSNAENPVNDILRNFTRSESCVSIEGLFGRRFTLTVILAGDDGEDCPTVLRPLVCIKDG